MERFQDAQRLRCPPLRKQQHADIAAQLDGTLVHITVDGPYDPENVAQSCQRVGDLAEFAAAPGSLGPAVQRLLAGPAAFG
jgi:hypothetical protein